MIKTTLLGLLLCLGLQGCGSDTFFPGSYDYLRRDSQRECRNSNTGCPAIESAQEYQKRVYSDF